jgi:hypothetical protein
MFEMVMLMMQDRRRQRYIKKIPVQHYQQRGPARFQQSQPPLVESPRPQCAAPLLSCAVQPIIHFARINPARKPAPQRGHTAFLTPIAISARRPSSTHRRLISWSSYQAILQKY